MSETHVARIASLRSLPTSLPLACINNNNRPGSANGNENTHLMLVQLMY